MIRLGQVDLVAFSHESDVSRRVFQRYLGYDELAQRAVEDAHHAATRHRHLVLLGPAAPARSRSRRQSTSTRWVPPGPSSLPDRSTSTRPGIA